MIHFIDTEGGFYNEVLHTEVIAKVRNLPFDRSTGSRLRVNPAKRGITY